LHRPSVADAGRDQPHRADDPVAGLTGSTGAGAGTCGCSAVRSA
jgi:hypothetical protein